MKLKFDVVAGGLNDCDAPFVDVPKVNVPFCCGALFASAVGFIALKGAFDGGPKDDGDGVRP